MTGLNPETPVLAYQSVITWIAIGAVAGWIAGLIVEGYGFGLVGNIIVGILGAAVAGVVAPVLGIYTHSTLGNLGAAIVGALLLLALIGLLRRL
jgi:uncharacterized membrane protein YeaQ/YmgE (transglycosylase-associated protein family)